MKAMFFAEKASENIQYQERNGDLSYLYQFFSYSRLGGVFGVENNHGLSFFTNRSIRNNRTDVWIETLHGYDLE